MAYLSTSADLISRTYRLLKEASASPTVWPSAQVVNYLDESHAHVCTEFRYLQSEWWATTSAGFNDYTFPPDLLTIRHVLYKASAGVQFQELARASVPDFWANGRDPEASGTATHWALAGVAEGPVVRLYPAPNTSAVSGIFIAGGQTPESIATSASPLTRAILPLVPLHAAMTMWQDQGVTDEWTPLATRYDKLIAFWKPKLVDMSPEYTEMTTFGDLGVIRPYSVGDSSWPTFDPFRGW